MDTDIFYSAIQIGDFPSDFLKWGNNRSLSHGCCTHSSEKMYLFLCQKQLEKSSMWIKLITKICRFRHIKITCFKKTMWTGPKKVFFFYIMLLRHIKQHGGCHYVADWFVTMIKHKYSATQLQQAASLESYGGGRGRGGWVFHESLMYG